MCAKAQLPPQQLNQKQQLHMSQRLIMSAHMQQAIRLLQIPLQELEPYIEEQVVQNPILEIGDDKEEDVENEGNERENEGEKELEINDKDLSILQHLEEGLQDCLSGADAPPIKRTSQEAALQTHIEQSLCATPSLQEELLHEAQETLEHDKDREIAKILIGYIDEFGFLKTPLIEIASFHHLNEQELIKILKIIQTFEPHGVGASSLQESLLIQLSCLHKEDSLAYQIIKEHYEELLHNHIPAIQKKLKCSYELIQKAIEKDIAPLDIHPGMHFSSRPAHAIIPDATLRQEGDNLIVDVERDYIPSLRLNMRYLKMLNNPAIPAETKAFIKRHLFSARWLMRNLQQRYSTVERIAQALAEKQRHFFIDPEGELIPLTMKSIAEQLELHESTIARTVSNKYIDTPRGIFSLRSFFTSKYVSEEGEDLSAATVKQTIQALISEEDKKSPLADEKISFLLKQKGIPCARRTVAKYRRMLQLGNAQQRRKF